MRTPELSYSSLRNLGISLACSALIVGCAGNHVEPVAPASGELSTSQADQASTNNQIASNDSAPVTSQAPDNGNQGNTNQTLSKSSTSPDHAWDSTAGNKPGDSTSTASNATTSVLEPAKTTFYFGVNQSKLSAQDKAVIAKHASFLKANPTLELEIKGHTDSTGSHVYNQYLSKRRAEAVASLLIEDGVKRSQLVIRALADNKPLPDVTDPGKNRRVDLEYSEMSMLSSN